MRQRVLITGVSQGLGLAMARQFMDRGHTLFGCARSQTAITQLQQTYGDRHQFAVVDVVDSNQVAAWATNLLATQEPPHLLINNAAVINQPAPLWEIPAAQVSSLIDVNIKGVVNVIQAFVPAMIAQQQGVIVNFSSGWGRSTSPGVAPYCGSKWAIEGLTRSLAQELPQSMAALPVNPGIIYTEMLETCFGPSAVTYPTPEEWARRAVPFLLQLGPQHNGQALTVPD
jgi:NADP-dependent 3-hydroxy acid dehydrogenase YdfG